MSYTAAVTVTETYTTVDIENVMRRFTADLAMIAQSSGAITEDTAREYAYDAGLLARNGYLRQVDLTLFSNGVEQRAIQYTVNTESGDLMMSRPGGVMWPKVTNPYFRIVLSYTTAYTADARTSDEKQAQDQLDPHHRGHQPRRLEVLRRARLRKQRMGPATQRLRFVKSTHAASFRQRDCSARRGLDREGEDTLGL